MLLVKQGKLQLWAWIKYSQKAEPLMRVGTTMLKDDSIEIRTKTALDDA